MRKKPAKYRSAVMLCILAPLIPKMHIWIEFNLFQTGIHLSSPSNLRNLTDGSDDDTGTQPWLKL